MLEATLITFLLFSAVITTANDYNCKFTSVLAPDAEQITLTCRCEISKVERPCQSCLMRVQGLYIRVLPSHANVQKVDSLAALPPQRLEAQKTYKFSNIQNVLATPKLKFESDVLGLSYSYHVKDAYYLLELNLMDYYDRIIPPLSQL